MWCSGNLIFAAGGICLLGVSTGLLRSVVRSAALVLLAVAATRAEVPIAPPPAPPVLEKEVSIPLPKFPRKMIRAEPQQVQPVTKSSTAVSNYRERAEDASQVSPALGSARSLVQNAVITEGAGAFHLANPSFADESFVLGPSVLPQATTKLFFDSRLGYATTSQFARLQVSTDEGASWSSVWSRQGSDGAGDGGYRLETVSLSAYAGNSVRLRFFYEFTSGSAYTTAQTSPPTGWFIDDIQIGEHFIKRPYTGTGDPTAQEVVLLELINRARADTAAEVARLTSTTDPDVLSAVSFFGVNFTTMAAQFATLTPSVQPLAMNGRLLAAARLHSQDMLANVFQGHVSSSNPPAPNQPYDDMGERLKRQGYDFSTAAENVYAFAKSPWHAHAGFNIDWGYGTGGMQDPPGHRLANHNGSFREHGIGAIACTNSSGSQDVGPLLVTQNFGTAPGGGQPLITGVTYLDGDNDGFYDEGEALPGIRVDVDGSSFYSFSSTHGAYAVPVPGDGTYRVSFLRPGLPAVSRSLSVVGGLNVKADYRGEAIVLEDVQRPTATTVRLWASPGGSAASLVLEHSGNLLSWTNLPHTQSNSSDGRIEINANLPTPPLRSFFRLKAEWAEP